MEDIVSLTKEVMWISDRNIFLKIRHRRISLLSPPRLLNIFGSLGDQMGWRKREAVVLCRAATEFLLCFELE
jgi:hypothetical protein